MKNFRLMMRLSGLVKPLAGYMVLAVTAGVLGHLSATFVTVLAGYGILSVLGEINASWLSLLWLGVLLGLIRGGLRYGEQLCNHYIAFKLLAHIRDVMFGALRRLCPAKLEGKNRGDLIASITSDVELLEVFYAHTISPALIALLFSVVMVLFIGSFHVYLGLLALVSYLMLGVVLPMMTSRASKGNGAAFRASSGQLSSFVLDTLRGLGELIQFRYGKQRMEEMETHTDRLLNLEGRMKRVQGQFSAITGTVLLLCDVAMLVLAGILYQAGRISFAGLLIPVLALFASFGPVLALAALGATLQNTLAAGGRVLSILDETPETPDITGKERVAFQGASAENITFSYDQETILQDFSAVVQPGKTLGITGKSGSGKSTFLKLLMRFWTVKEGAAKVSGRSVEEINTDNLRDMEGFVEQDTHLFHDSIAENLRIAKPDATREEMEAACRKASVHDFIMTLPQGYDTPVGELGDTLSGGERQRIGLARAFLHQAPLLLLDEPTSNLDSLNEGVILRSIQDHGQDHTVVLVSHRPSTMGIADERISMENGRMS